MAYGNNVKLGWQICSTFVFLLHSHGCYSFLSSSCYRFLSKYIFSKNDSFGEVDSAVSLIYFAEISRFFSRSQLLLFDVF